MYYIYVERIDVEKLVNFRGGGEKWKEEEGKREIERERGKEILEEEEEEEGEKERSSKKC